MSSLSLILVVVFDQKALMHLIDGKIVEYFRYSSGDISIWITDAKHLSQITTGLS